MWQSGARQKPLRDMFSISPVITSSYSSFINSDVSPSGDSRLSADIWCVLCQHCRIPDNKGWGQEIRGRIRKMFFQCHLSAARTNLVSTTEKSQRLGRERELPAKSISLSCSCCLFCSTVLACCTSKSPIPLRKEICVSRQKTRRWWNTPRRKECALSLLASRSINWTHFLLSFSGHQQKGNGNSLLGPGDDASSGGHCFWGVVWGWHRILLGMFISLPSTRVTFSLYALTLEKTTLLIALAAVV